jgi:hypothetical protein
MGTSQAAKPSGLCSVQVLEGYVIPESGGERVPILVKGLTRNGFHAVPLDGLPAEELPQNGLVSIKVPGSPEKSVLARCLQETGSRLGEGAVTYNFTYTSGLGQARILRCLVGATRRVLATMRARRLLDDLEAAQVARIVTGGLGEEVRAGQLVSSELGRIGFLALSQGRLRLEAPEGNQELDPGTVLWWGGENPWEGLRLEALTAGWIWRLEPTDPTQWGPLGERLMAVGGVQLQGGAFPPPPHAEPPQDELGFGGAEGPKPPRRKELSVSPPPGLGRRSGALRDQEMREALLWLEEIGRTGPSGRARRAVQIPNTPLKLGEDPEDLRSYLVATAVWAQDLAIARKHRNPAELAIAGLLHELGLLVRLAQDRLLMGEVHRFSRQCEVNPLVVETVLFGQDHARLTLELAQRWNLPAEVATAILEVHGDPASATLPESSILFVAQALACRTLGLEGIAYHVPRPIVPVLLGLGLSRQAVSRLLERSSETLKRVRTILGKETAMKAA